MKATQCILVIASVSVMALVGCTSNDADIAAQLKRKQQQQEMSQRGKSKSREEILELAREAFGRENFDEVQSITQKLLLKNERDFEAIVLSAKCTAASGFPLDAADRILTIPAEDPDFGKQALTNASRWLVQEGEFLAAVECEEKLFALFNETDARIRIARLLNNSGLRNRASEMMRQTLKAQPLNRRDLSSLCALSDSFIYDSIGQLKDTGELTQESLARARWLRENDGVDAAMQLASRLYRRFPQSSAISAFYGRLCAELDDEDRLSKWLSESDAELWTQADFWYAAGVFHQRSGAYAEAARCFMEAVITNPTDRLSYFRLSQSLSEEDQLVAADEAMRRFRLLKKTHRALIQILADQHSAEDVRELADALGELQRPLESNAWRLIAAKSAGESSDSIAELNAERDRIVASLDSPTETWLACGVDRNNWPMPGFKSQSSSEQIASQRSTNFGLANPIQLIDVAEQKNLEFTYDSGATPSDGRFFIHHQTGGGIGVLDFDLDGWPDCYCVQSGGPPMDHSGSGPNELFRNLDGNQFVAIGKQSSSDDRGYGGGIAAGDLNQDGFPDMVVANIGVNLVLINNGDGTFRQSPLSTNESHWTTSIALGDLSGDGLPEIVEVNYTDAPEAFEVACTGASPDCSPRRYMAQPDLIYSVGDTGEISRSALSNRLASKRGHGFAALIGNFDDVPGNELYIVNDTDENHYWVRSTDREQATLVDAAVIRGCATGLAGARRGCMGLTVADFDRNGKVDFHVTNFQDEEADLYLQKASSNFQNETAAYRMVAPSKEMVGWGTQAVDFDHDGWTDLATLNGHVVDLSDKGIAYKMKPQLFRHDGDRFQLSPAPADSYWSKPSLGRTLASIDFDRDGRVDLIAGHLDAPVALLENRSKAGNHLQIVLVGTQGERDAIGATVVAKTNLGTFTGCQTGGDGFLGTNEAMIDFGLGIAAKIKSVDISWPSGKKQSLRGFSVNQRYLVIEGIDEAYENVFEKEPL